MNTIGQAKKLSNTLKMHPTVGLEADAANTIDALLAELATLKQQEPAWVVAEDGLPYPTNGFGIPGTTLYLAAGAQSIPSGYQLVPVEPTPAMVEAAYHGRYEGGHPSALYQNMLAAAREQGSPTVRDSRTVESAQDHFAGADKPIQERIPENCGTGHCSCIACVQVCQWTPTDSDDMPGTWESACGEVLSFVEGGPVENNYRFCHGCGKPVGVRP